LRRQTHNSAIAQVLNPEDTAKVFPCLKNEEPGEDRASQRKLTLPVYSMHGRGHSELLFRACKHLK
jgi:hypothetical protein